MLLQIPTLCAARDTFGRFQFNYILVIISQCYTSLGYQEVGRNTKYVKTGYKEV